MGAFDDLIDRSIGIALDKQSYLTEQIGGWEWQPNMDEGSMTFRKGGATRVSPFQILGTEGYADKTWLWGWSGDGMPARLLRTAGMLRALGDQHRMAELRSAVQSLNAVSGHMFGWIATALSGGPGYFKGAYAGGALFVLLQSGELVEEVESGLVRVLAFWPEVLAQGGPFIIDQKLALRSYAEARGCKVRDERDGSLVVSDEGASFRAVFDKNGATKELIPDFDLDDDEDDEDEDGVEKELAALLAGLGGGDDDLGDDDP